MIPHIVQTLFLLVAIVCSFYMVNSKKSFQEDNMGKIVFSNVLFRHGDRTPIDPYPNDPYKNASFWPVEFGQLTNTGKEQEFVLGKWLRRRYDSLLTDKYSSDVIYVQSTDVDRTLMSAASNLAAIYPPAGSQVWNPYLKWQPIPIHTTPEKLDKLMGRQPCPAYEREFERVQQSPEIQGLIERFSNIFKILNENTGKEIKTLEDVEYIYNTLFIENLYNYTLPQWTQGIFPQQMEEAAKYSFALPTWTPKLARLKSGLLIKDMINHMVRKKENKEKPNYNVWLYSAHDTTVANLLNSLQVFDLQCPPYTAAVTVELRLDAEGNHNVAVFYRNSSAEEPYLLTVPGCTALCPLDQFIRVCEPLIPQDWDKECRASYLMDLYPSYNGVSVAALAVSSLLLLLLIVSVAFYRERSKRHTHCQIYGQFALISLDSFKVTSKPDFQNCSSSFKKICFNELTVV